MEKRYSFSSTLAGSLIGVFELTVVITIVFIAYFGGKLHKPKCLGICLIVLGIGTLVNASPQLFFGKYKQSGGSLSYEACSSSAAESNDDDCTSANIGAYIILLIGQILMAVGTTAVYTVGVAYLDEIIYPKFVSLHIGTVLTCAVIGPGFGFVIGSLFLSIYVDPWVDTDLETTDVNWVGAWWIAPVFMGILSLLLSVLFLMYPRWLPDSHLVKSERLKEMAKVYSSKIVDEDPVTLAVKEFPIHLKQLFTNASFMSTAFALAMIFVVKDGVVSFGPKYIESMFHITATAAGLLAGGLGITAAGIIVFIIFIIIIMTFTLPSCNL